MMKATIAAMAAKDPMPGPNSSIAMTEAASGAFAGPGSWRQWRFLGARASRGRGAVGTRHIADPILLGANPG